MSEVTFSGRQQSLFWRWRRANSGVEIISFDLAVLYMGVPWYRMLLFTGCRLSAEKSEDGTEYLEGFTGGGAGRPNRHKV